ncbi:hypothetical protein [Candidatus Enterococcus ferrettii]|uniref:DUF5057 domain-containing protein n=1 Tax=Candidatus Enterococcus ferrettii TaxID=2815324 RepID=A0ABV0ENG6_9ENTE|nr:hypothetical protein [Enterococcus sp. 665A]MBO1343092.1 hypothetical protein [Enterococcus sp. 665A]
MKKNIDKRTIIQYGLITSLIGLLIACIGYSSYLRVPSNKKIEASTVVTTNDFRLTADNKWDNTAKQNYAKLGWDEISELTQSGYKLYQSKAGNTWENRSLSYGKSIKVLNVYPDNEKSNTLKSWMDGLGLQDSEGNNLIQVTPVKITDYNNDPNSYLKSSLSGEYQYDVIMFGSWDSNDGKDISTDGAEAAREFILSGRGVLFGHDTVITAAGWNWWKYFHDEENYLGIGHEDDMIVNGNVAMNYWSISDKVKIINDGYLMKYPFEMQNELILDVPETHSVELSDKSEGTTWAEFVTDNPIYEDAVWRGGWYLKTQGNVAMIQTGHRNGESKEDERRIIANVLYNLAQVSLESNSTDYSVRDSQAPDEPELDIRCGDSGNLNIRVNAQDNGESYQWYIEADTKDQGKLTSDIVEEKIISNIAGYFYRVVDDPASMTDFKVEIEGLKDEFGRIDPAEFDVYVAPNDNSVTYNTRDSFTISEPVNSTRYIQAIAVDRMSNVSDVKTERIDTLTQNVDFEIERTGNEAKLIEVALNASLDNKMKSIEIQIPKNTGIKDFSSLTLPTEWYSFENSETTDYYSFSFAMETNNSTATIKTFLESLRFTIKNSVNTSGSIKVILHERVYTSWIDGDGKTHYYVFVPENSAPGKNWFEAYNGARKMKYRGLTGYLATITSEEEHDFIYDNIAKEPGWLGGTRGVLKNGSKINDELNVSQNKDDYDIEKNDWYWANGPETGNVFFIGKRRVDGGYAPANVYDGFSSIEPSNSLYGVKEYVLQFAVAGSKYWNDLPGELGFDNTFNHGYYVEFSEYGGQTESEEITDVCWKAAIPQKISLAAYDEQGNAVTEGDLVLDQQLRLDKMVTAQPKSLEFYSFVELRELDDTSRGMNYTVSGTYQEGKVIYSLREAILHVRQVVMKPSNELVVPTEGYIEIENRLFNSGSPAIDPTYQANTIVNSGKNADNPAFTNFILTTKPLTDDSDQVLIQPVIPSFYEYLGHYVTAESASHQNNTSITASPVMLNRGTIDATNELWLTLYLQPNQTADGENKTPQPYSWDYKKNDLGKIKTK